MKQVLWFAITGLFIGCTTSQTIPVSKESLDGTWVPVKQEIAGQLLPAAAFEKQKLIIRDSSYTVFAESVDKGKIGFHDGNMDIYGKEGVNAGKHFAAIYKLETGRLTICYNLSGDKYPDSFDTKNKPAYFLSVFRKEPLK